MTTDLLLTQAEADAAYWHTPRRVTDAERRMQVARAQLKKVMESMPSIERRA